MQNTKSDFIRKNILDTDSNNDLPKLLFDKL